MKKNNENYSDIIIEKKYFESWKYFLYFYKKMKYRTIIISLIAVVASSIVIAIPFLTQFISKAANLGKLNDFVVLSISILIIYIVKIILDFLNEYLGNHFDYKLEIEWRNLLIKKIHRMKITNFEIRPLSDFIGRVIFDLKDVLNFTFQFLTNIIYVSIVLIGGFIYLFIINWLIGLIPLILILFICFIFSLNIKKAVILRHYTKGLNSVLLWRTEENIDLISEIRNLSLEDIMMENYVKVQSRYLEANRKSNFQLAMYKTTGIALNVIIYSIILIIGSYFKLNKSILDSEFSGLISSSSLLVLPLTNLAAIFVSIIKISPSISRLYFWINQEEEENKGTLKPEFKGKIEFKNVSFSYKLSNGDKIKVFENFNLTINKNEFVNLYSQTGKGKSTLFKLMLRFYEIDDGQILFDDIPIEKIDLYHLRRSITLIDSKDYLFTEIVTKKTFKDQEKLAGILDELEIKNIFERKLEIDRFLGARGILLSESEKQILSFARGIYQDTKILLIDNADKKFDNAQIEKITNVLKKYQGEKTIIISSSSNKNIFGSLKSIEIR